MPSRCAIRTCPIIVPALRRGLFSRSADAGRSVPQRVSGYLQLQSLDASIRSLASICATFSAGRWTWWVPSGCCSEPILSLRGWHAKIFEEQATALYEIGVSEADARAIFGENLLRIIGR